MGIGKGPASGGRQQGGVDGSNRKQDRVNQNEITRTQCRTKKAPTILCNLRNIKVNRILFYLILFYTAYGEKGQRGLKGREFIRFPTDF
jgi:hypothetical protein